MIRSSELPHHSGVVGGDEGSLLLVWKEGTPDDRL